MKQTDSEKMIRVSSGKHWDLMCQKKNIHGSRVSQDTTNFIVATLMTTVAVFKKSVA